MSNQKMSAKITKVLKKLHALPLEKSEAVLWVIKRPSLRNGEATYTVASVKTEGSLQEKLVAVAVKAIKSSNHVEEYEYLSADQDEDTTLGLKLEETDFGEIAARIAEGSDNPSVQSAEDLFDSWAYAIELHVGDERILAVHKIPEGWKLKTKERQFTVLFRDRMLVDYEDAAVFKLERKIDFFAYDGSVFILDKKKFETTMNFRAGMEKNRDDLLADLQTLGVVDDINVIRDTAGTKLSYLRRMSMIKKNKYYKQPKFMENLRAVCKEKGWNVSFKHNKIVVTSDNVEIILKLLNNDRLASLLTEEIFDVSVKKKVPE